MSEVVSETVLPVTGHVEPAVETTKDSATSELCQVLSTDVDTASHTTSGDDHVTTNHSDHRESQPPSETRNAEDIGASSRMSSKEDVEKLIVDVEQKCRPITETVKTATDEVDRTKPSVDMRQKDRETPTSGTTDKTAADEDATGSSLEKTDEIVTNDRVEPQQQEQQQVTRYDEEMKTDGKNEDTEDDEITFKKSAKHATQQQIDVDCKQEST